MQKSINFMYKSGNELEDIIDQMYPFITPKSRGKFSKPIFKTLLKRQKTISKEKIYFIPEEHDLTS